MHDLFPSPTPVSHREFSHVPSHSHDRYRYKSHSQFPRYGKSSSLPSPARVCLPPEITSPITLPGGKTIEQNSSMRSFAPTCCNRGEFLLSPARLYGRKVLRL